MAPHKPGGSGKPWWVWLSLWCGTLMSVLAMILYILILDIDTPAIKPRPALENTCAALVYIAHTINIIASALTAFAILQREYVVVLCWVLWSLIHVVVMVLLIILSSFSVLPFIPARIILHLACLVFSVLAGLVMMRVYQNRNKREEYNWRDQVQVRPPVGEVNKMDLSRESNIL